MILVFGASLALVFEAGCAGWVRPPNAFLTLALSIAKPSALTDPLLFYSSRTMDILQAVNALGGLAQDSRLRVFRLLVRVGRDGMAAGDIAKAIGIPKNTLSSHLGILARANLVHARKEGRSVIYAVNLDGTRSLLTFLVEDCCQGEPSVCGPVIETTLAACCPD